MLLVNKYGYQGPYSDQTNSFSTEGREVCFDHYRDLDGYNTSLCLQHL